MSHSGNIRLASSLSWHWLIRLRSIANFPSLSEYI